MARTPENPEDVRLVIEQFLKTCRDPALHEPGEEQLPLVSGNYAVDLRNGRLTLDAWDDKRNISRRVIGVTENCPGRLELLIERFGKRTGALFLLDAARPANQARARHGERLVFREEFRRMVSRAFAGWKIAELSSEMDLHRSFSPNYPRAFVRKGGSGWALIGAEDSAADPDAALSFGIIWLEHLRRRETRLAVEGLALILPAGRVRTTCLRLRHLNPEAAKFVVFAHSGGHAERIDANDSGNLDTRLDSCRCPSTETQTRMNAAVERLRALPDVETVEAGDGAMSFRVRGLEFARLSGGQISYGIETSRRAEPSHEKEIEIFVRELARLRSPAAGDRESVLYQRNPEAWLESQVRNNVEEIDARLLPAPVYGQVPAFAGGDRDMIDLLAVERSGRLAVLELKASQDLHLPLQALDYWMRVAWHAGRGEFTSLGYFPGVPLRTERPRLLLIAPSLDFHPTSEAILRYFSPQVEVERVGLGVEWRKRVEVMFRFRGADQPS